MNLCAVGLYIPTVLLRSFAGLCPMSRKSGWNSILKEEGHRRLWLSYGGDKLSLLLASVFVGVFLVPDLVLFLLWSTLTVWILDKGLGVQEPQGEILACKGFQLCDELETDSLLAHDHFIIAI